MRCRLCGREGDFAVLQSRCRFDGSEIRRYACDRCDVIFGPLYMIDMPEAALAQQYVEIYSRYSEADSTDAEVALFSRLEPRAGGRYLNFGAGKSRAVELLRVGGHDVVGYDPAVPPAHAAELSGVYDGIFSNNVIEHLQDPVTSFKQLASLLAPGAVMAHRTPCYDYAYADTRFHLFFFCGRAVDALCATTGLRVRHREPDLVIFSKSL